jgi:hypothetical protein
MFHYGLGFIITDAYGTIVRAIWHELFPTVIVQKHVNINISQPRYFDFLLCQIYPNNLIYSRFT